MMVQTDHFGFIGAVLLACAHRHSELSRNNERNNVCDASCHNFLIMDSYHFDDRSSLV